MSDQLTCPLCAQSVTHTFVPHLRSEHKIEPEVFRARFPEQMLSTDSFAGFLTERNVHRIGNVLNYQLEVAGCPMTARYGNDHPLIPEPDPTFGWARWIRREFLTGTALTVILALLVLLVPARQIVNNTAGAARRCPVCDHPLSLPGKYCPDCGSRV